MKDSHSLTIRAIFDLSGVKYTYDHAKRELLVEAQTGEKNLGYLGFFARFTFREDGSLDTVGVWE